MEDLGWSFMTFDYRHHSPFRKSRNLWLAIKKFENSLTVYLNNVYIGFLEDELHSLTLSIPSKTSGKFLLKRHRYCN